jgi:hypothetical protein
VVEYRRSAQRHIAFGDLANKPPEERDDKINRFAKSRTMDLKTVFTKTAKGVTQVNQRTQSLSRELTRVLKSIDGKSTVEQLALKTEMQSMALQKALFHLQKESFVKVFEVKVEIPLTDFGGDDDFDFTPDEQSKGPIGFHPSPYRSSGAADLVERAMSTVPSRVDEAALAAAREKARQEALREQEEVDRVQAQIYAARQQEAQKAQIEARARMEHEAQLRARLEVEMQARKEAELRAMQEAERAQAAAEAARKALEGKLAEERRQREALSDTRARMTREQIEREAEQQRALAAARAQAEAEAQALAKARAQAEAEAQALAAARVQAEQNAKKQAAEFDAAQRELRHQLKAEIEAKLRVEMEQMLRSDIEESARSEVEAAVIGEAREEARRMLEARLEEERALLARAANEEKVRAEKDAKAMLAEQEVRIRAEMEARITLIAEERSRAEAEARRMAEAQAEAASKAAAEFAERLKAEEAARRAAEEEAAKRREAEQRLREEAEAKTIAELEARRAAEAEAHKAALQSAELAAKLRSEEEARRVAEAEAASRRDAEARVRAEAEEKNRADLEARKLAEAQAEEAARQTAHLSVRLKAEADARRAAEEQAQQQRAAEARNRARLEARAREEAEERARVEAEMAAKLKVEREAKIKAEAQTLIQQELRQRDAITSKSVLDAERRAREEAEHKAQLEAEAREIAARAVSEQVAKRERVEREAELMIAEARAAREKAEERARMDEAAEQQSRIAQIARLRELREKNEQLAHERAAANAGRPKRKVIKQKRNWLSWIAVSVISLLLIALALLQIVPLGAMNQRLEKSMSAWLHDDVSSANLRVALFPRPHVKLEQLALGKLQDAKAASGKLYLDFSSLLGDKFVVDTMELTDVTIAPDALQRGVKWAQAGDRGNGIEIENISLKNVKLNVPGVNIEVFDSDLKLDKKGAIVAANSRSRDGKWTLAMRPDDAPAAPAATTAAPAAPTSTAVAVVAAVTPPGWIVDFSARNMTLPFGAPIPISDVRAKGVWVGQELNFPKIEFLLLEGSGEGSLRAEWKQNISFQSNLTVQKLKVNQLAEVFTRDIALTGKMGGEFSASGAAGTLGEMLSKPRVEGKYSIADGAISNIDLVQAMRSPDSGGRGGQTKFTELTGQLRTADSVTRFEKVRLAGGVLVANANVGVASSTGNLSGTINSEIRSNVAQDRAVFGLSGNVARPVLKRGG